MNGIAKIILWVLAAGPSYGQQPAARAGNYGIDPRSRALLVSLEYSPGPH